MATCQSHYMRNRRGEKHTVTSGNSKHSPPENTERTAERQFTEGENCQLAINGNTDMCLRPFQQTREFQEKNAWLPQHRHTGQPLTLCPFRLHQASGSFLVSQWVVWSCPIYLLRRGKNQSVSVYYLNPETKLEHYTQYKVSIKKLPWANPSESEATVQLSSPRTYPQLSTGLNVGSLGTLWCLGWPLCQTQ